MLKQLFFIILLFMVSLSGPTTVVANTKDTLIFGIHPYLKPNKIFKMFKPIADHLSKVTGRQVKIVIGTSYSDILEQHRTGKIDFGYFGPASYVRAKRESGVIPLARIMIHGRGAFKGVIIVKSESPLTKLSQLRGKIFAFGDRESTLSHYVPHHMLMRNGINLSNLDKYAFTGNHDNVVLNVLNGTFDAGGVKPAVAKKYLDKGIRILTESEWIPEHLFAASKKLDPKIRKELQSALLHTDVAILKNIKSAITGIEPAKNEDYDGLRNIINDILRNDPPRQ